MIVNPHSFQTTDFLDSGEDGDGEDEMTQQDFTDFYKHPGGRCCKNIFLSLLGG